MGKELDTILILTDSPDTYRATVDALGKKCVYLQTADLLVKELLSDAPALGLILDAKKIMETDPDMRDKLFKLAAKIPVVRSRVAPEAKVPIFLDSLDRIANADASAKRTEARVKVRLEAVWAADKDPAMTNTNEGVLLNLSTGGAYMHVTNVLPTEDYIHIKILELRQQRPIHCAVRWKMTNPAPGQYVGIGLQFLDISELQVEEIKHCHLSKQ